MNTYSSAAEVDQALKQAFKREKRTFINYTWVSGSKYVGGYKNNNFHGQGTITFGKGQFKGDRYIGEFKDNEKHGQGTYTYADGTVEKGLWENNKFIGE